MYGERNTAKICLIKPRHQKFRGSDSKTKCGRNSSLSWLETVARYIFNEAFDAVETADVFHAATLYPQKWTNAQSGSKRMAERTSRGLLSRAVVPF